MIDFDTINLFYVHIINSENVHYINYFITLVKPISNGLFMRFI